MAATESKTTLNHRQQAEQAALQLAMVRLAGLGGDELSARCANLGLPDPAPQEGTLRIPLLGGTLELRPPDFSAVMLEKGRPLKPADHLLALHYLLYDRPVVPAHTWITFRDFPGGAFYWPSFLARSIQPLVQRMGNNLALLKERLQRFSAQSETPPVTGSYAARIHALGVIDLLLVYHPGDDEFPASAELLYDACARTVLCAEDAAVLGGRVCLGLL